MNSWTAVRTGDMLVHGLLLLSLSMDGDRGIGESSNDSDSADIAAIAFGFCMAKVVEYLTGRLTGLIMSRLPFDLGGSRVEIE